MGSADGAELYAAIEAMCDELYDQEKNAATSDVQLARTPGQRRMDALLELVRGGVHSTKSTSLAAKFWMPGGIRFDPSPGWNRHPQAAHNPPSSRTPNGARLLGAL